MRKTILMLVSCFALASPGQVPCRWTVESSRTAPGQFNCYRGETLSFEPTIKEYGATLTNYTATLFYQTNGMGSAWWQATNGMYFTPSMDVGASAYSFYIRAVKTNGISYRANAIVRMLGSPGETPNAIELPVEILDFASITYTNAPWLISSEWLAWLTTNTYVQVELDPAVPTHNTNDTAHASLFALGLTNAQGYAASAQSNAVAFAATNLTTRLFNSTNTAEFIDGAGKRYVISNLWQMILSPEVRDGFDRYPTMTNLVFAGYATYMETLGSGPTASDWMFGYSEEMPAGLGFFVQYTIGLSGNQWIATTNSYVLTSGLESDGYVFIRPYNTTNLLATLATESNVTNIVEALREYHVDSYTNVVWRTVYSNGWVSLVAFTNYPAN